MPGNICFPDVKCEPSSEEDDNDPQKYFDDQITSVDSLDAQIIRPVKLEAECENICHALEHFPPIPCSGECPLEALAPPAPAATPVPALPEPRGAATLAILRKAPTPAQGWSVLERHRLLTLASAAAQAHHHDDYPSLCIKVEPASGGEIVVKKEVKAASPGGGGGAGAADWAVGESETPKAKSWTQADMEQALQALRDHSMSLTQASTAFNIPSTTLWQRAHRLGIDTPKRDGGAKSWDEADLRAALDALRQGVMSANKASKAYGIPSSTLYKIARREGIRLAAPFNAAPVAWRAPQMQRALDAIRLGRSSVQRAATAYGIPTGTLYGRCKRQGIELSRNPTPPWSEVAMADALEAVRVGQMSINQAAIHYNLPYSSLYGRFKKCRYELQGPHQPHEAATAAATEQEPQPHPPPPFAYAYAYTQYANTEHHYTNDTISLHYSCDGLAS